MTSVSPNKGGDLVVGIVGGSSKDTADPQIASFEPDIAIAYIMYEGLTMWDFDMQVTNLLAETVEPNADGSVWKVKLQDGLTWHDGKPITADDVVYSMDRIVDPKDPKVGAATLSGLKVGGTKKVDNLTVEFHLEIAERPARRGARRTQRQDPAGGLRSQEPDRQRSVQDDRHEARSAVQVGQRSPTTGAARPTWTPSR